MNLREMNSSAPTTPCAPHHHQGPFTGFGSHSRSSSYQSLYSISSSPSPSTSSSSSGRNRISMACQYCRYRKIKCDGNSKCSNCIRTKRDCCYTEVSDEDNRASRERKAHLKSLKIKSLSSLNVKAAMTGRPMVRRGDSSPAIGSSPAIMGWSPSAESSAQSSPMSERPFPSVLTATPLHAAFVANMRRSSTAEHRTFERVASYDRPMHTPPHSRSHSPDPEESSRSTSYIPPPPPGYTSYFPASARTCTSPTSISTMSSPSPYTPALSQYSPFQPSSPRLGSGTWEKPSLQSPPCTPQTSTLHRRSTDYYSSPSYSACQREPFFYMPPSPRRSSPSPYANAEGLVGLGIALPQGYAPDYPGNCETSYEENHATVDVSEDGGDFNAVVRPQVVVYQGWGSD